MKRNKISYLITPILPGIFLLAYFSCFFICNRYRILFQEQLQLFLFDQQDFAEFVSRPEGLVNVSYE